MRNENRYSNGYLPKMAYWYVQAVIQTTHSADWGRAMRKYSYFEGRQREVYGDMTKEQRDLLKGIIKTELAKNGRS